MSKLTQETRSALQSARAKNRKLAVALGAAGLAGASIPKGIVTKVQAIEAYLDGVLAPAAKAETSEAADEAVAA